MTGPEHYRQAEEILEALAALAAAGTLPEAHSTALHRQAQVHATLALAAATALRGHEGLPERDRKAWFEAAATRTAPAIAERTAERAA